MNVGQFKALFPLKGQVTQEIIDNASIWRSDACIGALTLKAAVPEEFHDDIKWGDWSGGLIDPLDIGNVCVEVTTPERVSMMSIKEPREVTFIISP